MSSTKADRPTRGDGERPEKFGVSAELVAMACERHRVETTAAAHGVVQTLGHDSKPEPWDNVISLGQLWHRDDLPGELARLATRIVPDGRLHFCEPTGHGPRQSGDPWDITEQLWLAGWTPVNLHRFEVKNRGRVLHFVRGSARLTLGRDRPDLVP